MMNVSIYAGTGKGEYGQLERFEINGELVLTTAQLTKFYGCTSNTIRKNFHKHKEDFIEGEHFFKLTSEELKEFKRNITEGNDVTAGNTVNLNVNSVTFWTMLGAARFAKILKTSRAWEVYEQLALNYFSGKKISGKSSAEKISKNELTAKEKVKFLLQAAKITKDAVRRENLIATAEKIIISI